LPGTGISLGATTCQSAQNTTTCPTAAAALSGIGPWVLAPTGTEIAPGDTHSFNLDQAYTVGSTVLNTVGSAQCPVATVFTSVGGLNNVATLTPSAGAVSQSNACRPVAGPFLSTPLLTLNKVTTDYFGGAFSFTLSNTVQASGSVSTSAVGSSAQVDGDNATPGVQAFSVVSISADITIQESASPSGWTLTGASCTNLAGAAVGTLVGTTFTIPGATVNAAERFTCTFTNRAPPPPYAILSVVKTLTSTAGANPATFSISVTNTGTGGGTYALNDTPLLGLGVTPLVPSCTNVTAGGLGDQTPTCANATGPWSLADAGTVIAAGAMHRYTVNVPYVITVNATTSVGSGACPSTSPTTNRGGVNNSVTVVPSEGAVAMSSACTPLTPLPPILSVRKAITSAPGVSPVTYTISVSNTGGIGTYTLTDTPLPGTGISLGGATCQSDQNTVACPTAGAALAGTGSWLLAPAGTQIMPSTSHSYSLVQAFSAEPSVTNSPGSGMCPTDDVMASIGGLNNVASLTIGTGSVESRANACSAVAARETNAVAIPTLSQWALLLLASFMCLVVFVQRRST